MAKLDQWVSDAWLGGITWREIQAKMEQDGYSEDTCFAAMEVYEGLDRWHEKSLLKLAASARDWREL